MQLDAAESQHSESVAYEDFLGKFLNHFSGSPSTEQSKAFLAKHDEMLSAFFQSTGPTNLYIFSNHESELSCSFQFDFDPSFAHWSIAKTNVKDAHLATWVAANTDLESVIKTHHSAMLAYLQNYSQLECNQDPRVKSAVSGMIKKTKEIEVNLASICNTSSLPLLPTFLVPATIQRVYGEQSHCLAEYFQAIENEPSTDLFQEAQSCVTAWIASIRKFTGIQTKRFEFESVSFEIVYWDKYEALLNQLDEAMQQPEIRFCLELLKKAKKFHITMGFLADSGVKEARGFVQQKKVLLKDLPLEKLNVAYSWKELNDFLTELFLQLAKKVKNAQIPADFLIALVDQLCKEFLTKTMSISSTAFSNSDLHRTLLDARNLVLEWDYHVKELQSNLRETFRQRTATLSCLKFNMTHLNMLNLYDKLVEITAEFNSVMEMFQNLSKTANSLFNPALQSCCKRLSECVAELSSADTLSDTFESKATTFANSFATIMSELDTEIVDILSLLLQSDNSMQSVLNSFEKFHAVINRPKIVSTFAGYRDQILRFYQQQINLLKLTNRKTCKGSGDTRTAQLRYCKQQFDAERNRFLQLESISTQLKRVFDDNWSARPELFPIYNELSTLKEDCKQEHFANELIGCIKEQIIKFKGSIVVVDPVKNQPTLSFDFDLASRLFDYTNHLSSLNFIVPLELLTFSKDFERIFPYACSIHKLFLEYNQLIKDIDGGSELFDDFLLAIQDKICACPKIKWESLVKYDSSAQQTSRYCKFLNSLESDILKLKSVLHQYKELIHKIDDSTQKLKNCTVNLDVMWEIFEDFQRIFKLIPEVGDSTFLNPMMQKVLQTVYCRIFNGKAKKFALHEGLNAGDVYSFIINNLLNCKLDDNTLKILSFVPNPFSDSSLAMLQQSKIQDPYDLGFECNNLILVFDSFNGNYAGMLVFMQILADGQFSEKYSQLAAFKRIQLFNELRIFVEKQESIAIEQESSNSFKQKRIDDNNALYTPVSDQNGHKDSYQMHLQKCLEAYFRQKISAAIRIRLGQIEALYQQALEEEQNNFLACLPADNLWKDGLESKNFLVELVKMLDFKRDKAQITAKYNALIETTSNVAVLQSRFQASLACEESFDERTAKVNELLNKTFASSVAFVKSSYRSLLSKQPSRLVFTVDIAQTFLSIQKDAALVCSICELTNLLQSVEKYSKEMHVDTVPEDVNKFTIAESVRESLQNFDPKEILAFAIEFKEVEAVWMFLNDTEKCLNATFNKSTVGLSADGIRKYMATIRKSIESYLYNPKCTKIIDGYKSRLAAIGKYLQLIDDLQNPDVLAAANDRVSDEFASITFNTVAGFLLNEIFFRNANRVQAIISDITAECTLKYSLTAFELEFSALTIELMKYSSVEIISNFQHIFASTSELWASVESTKLSVNARSIERELSEFEQSLSSLVKVLMRLQELQKGYIQLDKYFTSSKPQNLRFEQSQFSELTRLFSSLISSIRENFPSVTRDQLFANDIEKALDLRTTIFEGIDAILSKARGQFPRFYFLSDQALFDFFSCPSAHENIQAIVPKIFPVICTLIVEESAIVGFISQQQEEVRFGNKILIDVDPSLVVQQFELEVATTLKDILFANLGEYRDRIAKRDMFQFHCSIPFQICQLILQIAYTESLKYDIKQLENLHCYLQSLSMHFSTQAEEKFKYKNLSLEVLRQMVEIQWVIAGDEQMKSRFDSMLRWSVDEAAKSVKIGFRNFSTTYGFEYLDVYEKVVDTPVTCRFYRVMIAAIATRYGGCPFGPAGTGKTEVVKALGHMLGRQVFVFNCNEGFNYSSIIRIMKGLISLGAWGCFDEINRLEVANLSSIANFIASVQGELRSKNQSMAPGSDSASLASPISLTSHTSSYLNSPQSSSGKLKDSFVIHPDSSLFVTLNPAYTGRVALPSNLVSLFRTFCLNSPDVFDIVKGIMFVHGIQNDELVDNFVSFFERCSSTIPNQEHYDFGLRTMKAALRMAFSGDSPNHYSVNVSGETLAITAVIRRAIYAVVAPRLYTSDLAVFLQLLTECFSTCDELDVAINSTNVDKVHMQTGSHELDVEAICENSLLNSEKLHLIHSALSSYDGCIFYGKSGSLKSSYIGAYFQAFYPGAFKLFRIEPSSSSVYQLIGSFDETTQKWRDGIIPLIFRTINHNNVSNLHYGIHFDGPAYSEWMENFNSLFDDNRFLSLPNGESIPMPRNLKFIFETDTISRLTKATFTRCGLVYFDRQVGSGINEFFEMDTPQFDVDKTPFDVVFRWLDDKSFRFCLELEKCSILVNYKNILKSILKRAQMDENMASTSYSCDASSISNNIQLFSLFHSVFNLLSTELKSEFVQFFQAHFGKNDFANQTISTDGSFETLKLPLKSGNSLLDFRLVPTVESMRWEYLLSVLLNANRNVLLCGPSGSGKTMTILDYLLSSRTDSFDSLLINFSKNSTLTSFIQAIMSRCNVVKRSEDEYILAPKNDKPLIVFIDEINLPRPDTLGNVPVLNFLTFLLEYSGFWHGNCWLNLKQIQFVAACNPSTDPGRYPLTPKLLKHCSVFWVDQPENDSLLQIYSAMLRHILKVFPLLRHLAEPYAQAMLDFYTIMKIEFGPSKQPHYTYSARELTKWVCGLDTLLQKVTDSTTNGQTKRKSTETSDSLTCNLNVSPDELHKMFTFEGCRVFIDRLIDKPSKKTAIALLSDAMANISSIQFNPLDVWYCDWISVGTTECNVQSLLPVLEEKVKLYTNESDNYSSDNALMICEDNLLRILRISCVLRRPLGHLILMGDLGVGQMLCVKFACWLEGVELFTIKMHSNYTLEMFDVELRQALRRVILADVPICFFMDCISYQVMSAFLERINVVLANGEVFDLFDEKEMQDFLSVLSIDNIRDRVCRLFHTVIAMLPPSDSGQMNESMNASPAIFTRCLVDWIDDWSDCSISTVVDTILSETDIPDLQDFYQKHILSLYHEANSMKIDRTNCKNKILMVSPEELLILCNIYVAEYEKTRDSLIKTQIRTSNGLNLLNECQQNAERLALELVEYRQRLQKQQVVCDAKLEEMAQKQREAEREKLLCEQMKVQLSNNRERIANRTADVQRQLDEVLPLIAQAQTSVRQIKKQQLVELKSMNNPPEPIKVTLEAVCLLLGFPNESWRAIQSAIRREDFINSVLNFDAQNQLNRSALMKTKTAHLSNPQLTFELVDYASKACGPLLNWIVAQVKHAEIIDSVAPLQEEISALQNDASENEAKLQAAEKALSMLLNQIDEIKSQYSIFLQEYLDIKTNFEHSSIKLERSEKLFESLQMERERWSCSTEKFKQKLIGLPEEVWSYTKRLYFSSERYSNRLNNSNDQTDTTMSSNVKLLELCNWSQETCQKMNSLLFYSQNNLVPFIVDDTADDKIISLLAGYFSPRKIQIVSFQQESWLKSLENALSFGNILVLKDAHQYDTLLNPILLNQFSNFGGKKAISFPVLNAASKQTKPIVVSANFKLFLLSKRRPQSHFLNFAARIIDFSSSSVGSLDAVCLDVILKKADGKLFEQKISTTRSINRMESSLKEAEGELLTLLSTSTNPTPESLQQMQSRHDKGMSISILENDDLIQALSRTKTQSMQLAKDLSENVEIMVSIDRLSLKYKELGNKFANLLMEIYTNDLLNREPRIFSLHSLIDTFEKAFDVCEIEDILLRIFNVVSRSLSHEHSLTLLLLMWKLFLAERRGKSSYLGSASEIPATQLENYKHFIEENLFCGKFKKSSITDAIKETLPTCKVICALNMNLDITVVIQSIASDVLQTDSFLIYSLGQHMSPFEQRERINWMLKNYKLVVLNNCDLDVQFVRALLMSVQGVDSPPKIILQTKFDSHASLIQLVQSLTCQSCILFNDNNIDFETSAAPKQWANGELYKIVYFYDAIRFKGQFYPYGGLLQQYSFTQQDLKYFQHILQDSQPAWEDAQFVALEFVFGPVMDNSYDNATTGFFLSLLGDRHMTLDDFKQKVKDSVCDLLYLRQRAVRFWQCNSKFTNFQFSGEPAKDQCKGNFSIINLHRQSRSKIALLTASDNDDFQLMALNFSSIPVLDNEHRLCNFEIEWTAFVPQKHRLIPLFYGKPFVSNWTLVACKQDHPDYAVNCCFYLPQTTDK